MGILKKGKFQAITLAALLVSIPLTALASSVPGYCSPHDDGITHYVQMAADALTYLLTGYVNRCAP